MFRYWLADSWYSMSYLYYSAVGFIGTVAAGLLITLLTGESNISLAHTDSNKTLKRTLVSLKGQCIQQKLMRTVISNKVILKGSYIHLFIHK